jgi:hypothetical protein
MFIHRAFAAALIRDAILGRWSNGGHLRAVCRTLHASISFMFSMHLYAVVPAILIETVLLKQKECANRYLEPARIRPEPPTRAGGHQWLRPEKSKKSSKANPH